MHALTPKFRNTPCKHDNSWKLAHHRTGPFWEKGKTIA